MNWEKIVSFLSSFLGIVFGSLLKDRIEKCKAEKRLKQELRSTLCDLECLKGKIEKEEEKHFNQNTDVRNYQEIDGVKVETTGEGWEYYEINYNNKEKIFGDTLKRLSRGKKLEKPLTNDIVSLEFIEDVEICRELRDRLVNNINSVMAHSSIKLKSKPVKEGEDFKKPFNSGYWNSNLMTLLHKTIESLKKALGIETNPSE